MTQMPTSAIATFFHWTGVIYTLIWYTATMLYFALRLLGNECGRFFQKWGPVKPAHLKWWQATIGAGALPVAITLFFSNNGPLAIFLGVLGLGYAFTSMVRSEEKEVSP